MATPPFSNTLDDTTTRLLAEGTRPLREAAALAGLSPVPSLKTLLRAASAGQLETLLVAGRKVSSPAAIARWVAASQRRATGAQEATR